MEIALWVNERDNVATVFSECVKAGSPVCVVDKKGSQRTVVAQNDIPYAHKIALWDVHVHNLDSERGRGDKQGA